MTLFYWIPIATILSVPPVDPQLFPSTLSLDPDVLFLLS